MIETDFDEIIALKQVRVWFSKSFLLLCEIRMRNRKQTMHKLANKLLFDQNVEKPNRGDEKSKHE